jgi:hypothetical protein
LDHLLKEADEWKEKKELLNKARIKIEAREGKIRLLQ